MKKRWGCLLLVSGLLLGSACAVAEQEESRFVPSETSVQNGMQRSDWQASPGPEGESGGVPADVSSELWLEPVGPVASDASCPGSAVPSNTEVDESSSRKPEVESEERVPSGPADVG